MERMTGAVAILIMYKIAAMMLVIGCPLAMASGFNPPEKPRKKRKVVPAKRTKVAKKTKAKKAKKSKPHKLSAHGQRLVDDYFIRRDFGDNFNSSRMPL